MGGVVKHIDLERIVSQSDDQYKSRKPTKIYFLDQVLFDSIVFNEDSWNTALDFLEQEKPEAVVVSGALIRTDRPEYKIDSLVAYKKSEQELAEELKQGIKQYDAVHSEMKKEFKIAEEKFTQLRNKLPKTRLYYLWSKDDEFSANRMAHYHALKAKSLLQKERDEQDQKIGTIDEKLRKLYKDKKAYKKKVTDMVKSKINYKVRLDKAQEKLDGVRTDIENEKSKRRKRQKKLSQIETVMDEYKRPRKETAFHHIFSREGYQVIKNNYDKIFKPLDIRFPGKEALIAVNGSKFLVRAEGEISDTPKKSRPKRMQKSVAKSVEEYVNQGILGYVEMGSGIHWAGRIDSAPSPEDVNSGYKGVFFRPDDSFQESVYANITPVFHDQSVIKEMIQGKFADRFSGRTPTGNRKHNMIAMYENGAISGLFGLVIDKEGRVGRDVTSYDAFLENNTSVLSPQEWGLIESQSDEHFGHPNSNYALIDGGQKRRLQHFNKNIELMGTPVQYLAHFELGDSQEGNSHGWRGAGAEHDRDFVFKIKENLVESKILYSNNLEDRLNLLATVLGHSITGNFENMGRLMEEVADYMYRDINPLVQESPLETIFAAVGSNHFFLSSRAFGVNPFQVLKAYLKKENTIHRTTFDDRDGRSNVSYLTDFGRQTNGETYFGPYNVFLQHDPAGMGKETFDKLLSAVQKHNAHLGQMGHYHVSGYRAGRMNNEPNTMQVAIANAHMQNLLNTDLVKDGRSRNQGSISTYIPKGENTKLQRIAVFENEPLYLQQISKQHLISEVATYQEKYENGN